MVRASSVFASLFRWMRSLPCFSFSIIIGKNSFILIDKNSSLSENDSWISLQVSCFTCAKTTWKPDHEEGMELLVNQGEEQLKRTGILSRVACRAGACSDIKFAFGYRGETLSRRSYVFFVFRVSNAIGTMDIILVFRNNQKRETGQGEQPESQVNNIENKAKNPVGPVAV